MPIPFNKTDTKKYSEQEVLEFVNKIILQAPEGDYFKPSDFFGMYEFPPLDEIKKKMFSLGYIEHNTNVTYILTDQGRKAKHAGGHFQFEETKKLAKGVWRKKSIMII